MRTLKEVIQMRDKLLSDTQRKLKTEFVQKDADSIRRKARKEVAFLNRIILYLEHDPLEKNMIRDLEDINRKIESRLKSRTAWIENNLTSSGKTKKELESEYNKTFLKNLKDKAKTIEWILNQ